MRSLGYIVSLGPGLFVADSEGAVVAFAEEVDARNVAGFEGRLIPLVRYRRPRGASAPAIITPAIDDDPLGIAAAAGAVDSIDEDPPEPPEHDPGPEVDDQGGMTELRAEVDDGPAGQRRVGHAPMPGDPQYEEPF